MQIAPEKSRVPCLQSFRVPTANKNFKIKDGSYFKKHLSRKTLTRNADRVEIVHVETRGTRMLGW